MNLDIFLYEMKHFVRDKAKLFSYIFFMSICILSLYNGIQIAEKQVKTILEIEEKKELDINKMQDWFKQGIKGPEGRSWVNIEDPYWAIRYTPTYIYKNPSPLLPLGIGQSQQFGFYKKINRWSSTYDTDVVEEISNYERLINGNIDFSFLIIYLLPILFIILTYNINGLEKDLRFDKLISIQNKKTKIWIFKRWLFYFLMMIFSVNILILFFSLITSFISDYQPVIKIILISNLYILFFCFIFYILNIYGKSSSAIAFKMISVWLAFCVIIPGSIHQYIAYKYPVNYMTDFLDVNRKETYDVFKFENDDLLNMLIEVHPEIKEDKNIDDLNLESQKIRRSISSIVNQMNINAALEIDKQNENKNRLIALCYFINPVSYIQNLWNSYTSTDYDSYKEFRSEMQNSINARNRLMVLEMWNKNTVDMEKYQEYLKVLE